MHARSDAGARLFAEEGFDDLEVAGHGPLFAAVLGLPLNLVFQEAVPDAVNLGDVDAGSVGVSSELYRGGGAEIDAATGIVVCVDVGDVMADHLKGVLVCDQALLGQLEGTEQSGHLTPPRKGKGIFACFQGFPWRCRRPLLPGTGPTERGLG